MAIQISNEQELAVDEDSLVELAGYVLTVERVEEDAELSIALVGEETMLDLNASYRGKDYPTDVLSFEVGGDMPTAGNLPRLLGDVVICPAVAEKQAIEFDQTLDQELSLLLVHGILHLFGYDHDSDEDAELMEARERLILTSFSDGVNPDELAKGGFER
ncbi:MAG: rRNA maturation RNase YbeY [Candidatus Aquicultor primus]|uniref:Endoribonuclease YbeY n=1 Tax=Candidatus Aquicultor primus TaxID=1797195 RepID=A0A1F2UH12_9ACTN|nr:MAG: rRNA maturation RNase YbeY [Candidatus Aquicultor primus]HCG99629.1 rRNA maturation RNase YbeY [Actinomycetota bacterium]